MTKVKEKTARKYSQFDVRMAPEIKERVQRAAHICGLSLTEFTKNALDSRAKEVLEANERKSLS